MTSVTKLKNLLYTKKQVLNERSALESAVASAGIIVVTAAAAAVAATTTTTTTKLNGHVVKIICWSAKQSQFLTKRLFA